MRRAFETGSKLYAGMICSTILFMRLYQKPLIFCLVLIIAGLAAPARAITSQVGGADDLGFGISLGQPMGVNTKYWLSSSLAVDGFMGYHFNHNFDTHLDYLWHSFSSF